MKTIETLPVEYGERKVEVDWEVGDQYDEAGDGYCFMHHAEGTAEDGHTFSATAVMVSGELEEIEDVEYQGKK